MPAEADVVVRLARLKGELRVDVDALTIRADELRGIIEAWDASRVIDRPNLVLAAVNIHGWYTALETGLERVARLLDQSVPAGASWHVDLLSQMQIEIPGVRPPALPTSLGGELNELRRFRHFFRNAYVVEFDPKKVRQHSEELLRAQPLVASALEALLRHVEATLKAASSDFTA